MIPTKKTRKVALFFCLSFWLCPFLNAQPLSQDSVKQLLKGTPAFSIYKDSYLITGIPTHQGISTSNSDIKYQISLQQRLTNAVLPFNTYLSFVYTQVAFWNVYARSSPFAELNFNPGISLSRLFFKNKKLVGVGAMLIEHQSNGKKGEESRSWDNLALVYSFAPHNRLRLTGKAWIPFSYRDDNPDLLSYIGYGECKVTWIIQSEKLILDVIARKGTSLDGRGSAQIQLFYRPFKSENQFLMIQWFEGYAENLANYNLSTSMIRIGVLIKTVNFGMY